MVTKKIETLSTQNDSFGKNWGAKNLGKRILQNIIEKSFIKLEFFHWLKLTHVFHIHSA
jgi:hypothetical protein